MSVIGGLGWPVLAEELRPVSVSLSPTNAVSKIPALTLSRKKAPTTGEAWEKFEAEFGITQPATSVVKGSLQNAKYRLDHTTFALRSFVDNVSAALRFDYSVGDLVTSPSASKVDYGTSGNRLLDAVAGARLKSEIDLTLSDRQFIGVKLVLPLGD